MIVCEVIRSHDTLPIIIVVVSKLPSNISNIGCDLHIMYGVSPRPASTSFVIKSWGKLFRREILNTQKHPEETFEPWNEKRELYRDT